MPLPRTETSPGHGALDRLDADAAVRAMFDGQQDAIACARSATPDLVAGASLLAHTVRAGGALVYAGAGSSGLMALADASELPGTFGIPQKQIQIHMAGGVPTDGAMPGHTEDKAIDIRMSRQDVLIVLSASGTTPYALAAAAQAKRIGTPTIAVSNNRGAPLLQGVEVAVCLDTPPEAIAGSTRLGAGTAQKVALNVMSTMMGVQLGHVYRGLMVNLTADNDKLRKRARHIICEIVGLAPEAADEALRQAGGQVKLAILIAAGRGRAAAQAALEQHNGQLGPCLKSDQTI